MEKKLTLSKRPLQWLSLVVVMLLAFLPDANAFSSTYYYSATVTANPSDGGGGKVYITSSANQTPENGDYVATKTITGSERNWTFIGDAGATFHLFAQANTDEDWIFDHWAEGSVNGTQVGTPGVTALNSTKRFSSTSSNSPTEFKYFAIFKEMTGLIKVKSADPQYGSVSIDKPDNKKNDLVTLKAFPDVANGVKFLGWTKDDGTENLNPSPNPFELTANDDTKGTYYAHFSEPAERLYVRIQNKATGRFLCFYGTTPAKQHQIERDGGDPQQDGFIFENSLQLIDCDKAQGNPETVFMRSGTASGQGVTTDIDLSVNSPRETPVSYHLLTSNQKELTMVKEGDTYKIYSVFDLPYNDGGDTAPRNCYLCDDGESDWLQMMYMENSGVAAAAAEWYVYFLDEETTEGAFGANAKETYTKDGLFYTTMYTDFAYECLDGVKAYYLDINSDSYDEKKHLVYFSEIPKGIVPAFTAVVLECPAVQNEASNSPSAVTNRLIPLITGGPKQPEISINEGSHFLKGYVSVNGEKVGNNKSTMYVLSYNTVGLGFYHYSGANMTPNKAYLDTYVPVDGYQGASTVSFVFGKDKESLGETDKITLHEAVVDDNDAPIYDLQGRKMKGNLPKGIYVRNGQKFVVK